jgi:hypothetical protein
MSPRNPSVGNRTRRMIMLATTTPASASRSSRDHLVI